VNPSGAERTDHESTDKISEDQRLPEKMRGEPQHPREQNAQCDISDEIVHVPK
jgi:hypothetical protein